MEEYRLQNKVSDARVVEFSVLIKRTALPWSTEQEIVDWFLDVYADWQECKQNDKKEALEENADEIEEICDDICQECTSFQSIMEDKIAAMREILNPKKVG